ncbi:MAG: hypothetical protein QCI00_08115, partial [Candidatus Thermoplasmatota archaeon]|nr:hypothetical protein [Candidatus Thermoplasmatota archaeon]
MKLDENIINQLNNIFISRNIQRNSDAEPHAEYFFDESLDEEIKHQFRDLGMEVDDYHYRWLAFCMDEYASMLNEHIGKDIEDIPYDDIEDSIICDLEPDVYTN